jgi:hypothetical protein
MVLKILTKIFQLTVKFHDSNATWYLLFNIACRTLVLKGLNIANLTWSQWPLLFKYNFSSRVIRGTASYFFNFNSRELTQLRADIRLQITFLRKINGLFVQPLHK